MDDSELVYSTDAEKNKKCPRCRKLMESCICQRAQASVKGTLSVVLRLEKSGRGGKVVTVIDGFPRIEEPLRDLSKELKARCGAGGTYRYGERFGLIEIQGDKREQIRKILEAKSISYKG